MARYRGVIVGALPLPVGGVSTFIYRLLENVLTNNDVVIDLYPSDSKVRTANQVPISTCRGSSIQRFACLFIFLLRNQYSFVHFNFSTLKALFGFLILPKKSKWILTLHNGGIAEEYERGNKLTKWILKRAIKRFDVVHSISESQRSFYDHFQYQSQLVEHFSTYIRPSKQLSPQLPTSISEWLKLHKSKHRKILLSSGYWRSVYNFEEMIRFLASESGQLFAGIIVIYGEQSARLISELKTEYSNIENLLITNSWSQEVFLELQMSVDFYVRLNSEDSFGIAVADAVTLGVKVLASDVCERYPGTIIFPISEIENWHLYLNSEPNVNFAIASEDLDSQNALRQLYNKLS
ncbi:hypothetical protein ACFOD1_02960 [Pseudidiomarina halophila]|uniref:Glycosyl transferase family 1 domain-containing protein n=1 Tax=Pseudidiomarina halophila TaxID=1449799 RepID=A0A432XYU0_9GAMM|nr:glycosyltransferase family 1 protein [Pseudidiomarina halophila]RUO53918.1 hypothetical protein CWI69_00300 [Pseudidiomarina halophila]